MPDEFSLILTFEKRNFLLYSSECAMINRSGCHQCRTNVDDSIVKSCRCSTSCSLLSGSIACLFFSCFYYEQILLSLVFVTTYTPVCTHTIFGETNEKSEKDRSVFIIFSIFFSSSCSIFLFRTLVNLFAVVNKRGRERANRSERHLIFYKIWQELVLVLIAITIIVFSNSFFLFFYIAVSVNSKPIAMILMFFISCTYSLDWPMLYHHYMLYSPSQALFLALFHKVENLFGWHIVYHHYGVVFL